MKDNSRGMRLRIEKLGGVFFWALAGGDGFLFWSWQTKKTRQERSKENGKDRPNNNGLIIIK